MGRIFYPCSKEALAEGKYAKAGWLPSWTYARGYGQFLTAWGGTSLAKTLLKPVIVGVTWGLGRQSFIDCYLARLPACITLSVALLLHAALLSLLLHACSHSYRAESSFHRGCV